MNTQIFEDENEPPSCARCDEVGTSLLVEAGEQGRGIWLCQRHLARLRAHAQTVPELDGMLDGALVITEVVADGNSDGRGGGAG